MSVQPKSPTMSPEEVATILRSIGVHTSATRIREGISQGKYPFGIVIQFATPIYEIYRKDFEAWALEKFYVSENELYSAVS